MAGALLLRSHKKFYSEVINSSNYSKVLSVATTYDYTLTNVSGKDDPRCYIDHRNHMAASHFHTPYRRKVVHSVPCATHTAKMFLFPPPTRTVIGHRSPVIPRLHIFNGELRLHVGTIDNHISLSHSQKGYFTPQS